MKAKTTKYGELKIIFTEAEVQALYELMAVSSTTIQKPQSDYTGADEELIGWPLFEAAQEYLYS